MNEFQKVLKFICSACGEHENVSWNYADVYNKMVAVECLSEYCGHTAEIPVGETGLREKLDNLCKDMGLLED